MFWNKPKVLVDEKKIDRLLSRGVDKIYPSREALKQLLMSGKRLRLYQGFDPTGKDLHIGHMVGLRKHREWQELGHEVIFLIGDGTGTAGDPSGKKKTRDKFFTKKELRENAQGYLRQAGKLVRFDGPNPVKVMYNGDWLDKLTKEDVLNIAQNFSVQQLIERDMFQERLRLGESINMREFLYPLLQGYDSVAMGVDLEIGGTDQTFNMLAGRTLMKTMKGKEKFVMTTPLLVDAKGVKIGKSEGNVIALNDEPSVLFGKIMSLGDDAIIPMLNLLSDISSEEIVTLDIQKNAMSLKKMVAEIIIKQLYGVELASQARAKFENTFGRGEFPTDALEIKAQKESRLVDILVSEKIIESKSEFRRLIEAGAISDFPDQKISDPNEMIGGSKRKIKVGKKTFVLIVPL